MSKEPLRSERNCLNCSHLVEQRYRPNCGQENAKVRKTFYHLFVHFFEDFTHYESKFWRTIIYLIFKPAALTKAYVLGKRLSFLPPVRLYIFLSFITFFLISLFPDENSKEIVKADKIKTKTENVPSLDSLHIDEKSVDGLTKVGLISQKNNDTIKKILQDTKDINPKEITDFGYKNTNELDSIQIHGTEKVKVSQTKYWFLKKWLAVKEENTNEEIIEKFSQSFANNLPKVLFLYMPVFALILWLFHDKKKWYYYDHGIFTLHFFSFLLLLILLLFFIDKLFSLSESSISLSWIHLGIKSIGILWMFYYFFPAHRLFYGETYFISAVKSTLVFVINLIIISVIMVLYALYTYINLN
ncbi:DUF3667 domain-containing protein [Flavobacterium sinopsychrotolerans]|uniref:DUF3667 domain-containing protein n=1 Tax=Flavobacterium sinopsychrotolerans TaxID=604089 RepID=A0A1H8M277_9FLAO|nr:DUF3667 domain-containing protein [Flavobacterium sinopsychrotolerans]SEO11419.1 Protein of unknown function [Flavobacterium sinopsychrotolerans]